jgi:hypothetical protein
MPLILSVFMTCIVSPISALRSIGMVNRGDNGHTARHCSK